MLVEGKRALVFVHEETAYNSQCDPFPFPSSVTMWGHHLSVRQRDCKKYEWNL